VAPDLSAAEHDPAALRASRLERYVHLDRANHPYLRWQLEQFEAVLGQRILEIGCGVGGILELLGERERLVGLEIEPELAAFAAERFAGRPACDVFAADISKLDEALRTRLAAERFDSIVSINVLEHIRDDVAALQTISEILIPGGHLALLVPAHMALYGAYDELDGHYRRYGRGSLRAALAHTDLEPLEIRYFNSVGAIGWWAQYKLLRRKVHGQGSFGAMKRIIPLLRPLERTLAPPFGLSVIALCRKARANTRGPDESR